MLGSIVLVIQDFPLFFLNVIFQTKEQQDQLLNQSNEVFLYCGFLDYRSEIVSLMVVFLLISYL